MELAGRKFENKASVSYTKMAQRLEALIAANDYLTPEEKVQYTEIEQHYAGLGGVPQPSPRFAFPAPPEVEAIPATKPRTMTQDDIDTAIQMWNGDVESKHTVVRHMSAHARDRETAAFLQNEYGGDLATFPVTVDGVTHDMPWAKVQRRIFQLIEADRFYTQEEQDGYDDIDTIAIREHLAEHGIVNGEVADQKLFDNSPFIQQVTADAERLADEQATPSYKLGDTFYMDDRKSYTILWIGPHEISYQDPTLPYMSKLMKRVDFEALLRDNPRNNHFFDATVTISEAAPEQAQPVLSEEPKIDLPYAENFRITDDNLGAGGQKTKYHMNVEAIRTLQQIEAEGRSATVEEQETLAELDTLLNMTETEQPQQVAPVPEDVACKAARPSVLENLKIPPKHGDTDRLLRPEREAR